MYIHLHKTNKKVIIKVIIFCNTTNKMPDSYNEITLKHNNNNNNNNNMILTSLLK